MLRELADDLSRGIVFLRAHQERDEARRVAELRAQQLRTLASALIEAEQRERRRLAGVLHDHLQQLLVGAKLNASTIRATVARKSLQDLAEQLSCTLDEAIQTSGSLTSELSPPVLHERGLAAGLEWLGRQLRRSHHLEVEVDADPEAEPAEEQARILLFEAVRELLLNAIKHANVDRASVRMKLRPDREIEVTVSDEGVGFDPSGLQAEASLGGAYGLFSIRERLSYLGGRMEIESVPGRGSRFTLIAPVGIRRGARVRTAEAGEPRKPAEPEMPLGAAKALAAESPIIRVLVADDHPVLRRGLVLLLKDLDDIEVVGEAADGEETVRLAGELKPDVVLMDVSMPHLDGFEATRLVTARLPNVWVIGLSMHEEATMAHAMLRAGAAAYVTKGGPTDKLIAAIRASRSRRDAGSPPNPDDSSHLGSE